MLDALQIETKKIVSTPESLQSQDEMDKKRRNSTEKDNSDSLLSNNYEEFLKNETDLFNR